MSECVVLSAGVDISDADAAVGDVKSPKTFYSVEEPKKTGTMPTVTIVAANDNYPAGYHAGDGGGLDAIDTDLTPTNIKSGVNIFGKVGTFSISPTFQRYWYGNLTPSATYTPAVSGFFAFGGGGSADIWNELLGSSWVTSSTVHSYNSFMLCVGDGTNLRAINKDASTTYECVIMRATLQHSSPTYQRYTFGSLAPDATYTPGATGLFTVGGQSGDIYLQLFGATWVLNSRSNPSYEYGDNACIGVAGYFRIHCRSSASGSRSYVLMRWY